MILRVARRLLPASVQGLHHTSTRVLLFHPPPQEATAGKPWGSTRDPFEKRYIHV